MLWRTLTILCFVCSACAATNVSTEQNATTEYKCEQRAITGSHVVRATCVEKKQVEARRDQDQKKLRDLRDKRVSPDSLPSQSSPQKK